ncbi:hypothetical protein DFQ14_1077 [Halopolyspora algeriensis]|uniref:Uncharacterized protein n=1 Tax=Halopolyspora algeriensis TaxID=1500506 RepID=A0A368VNM4_9ACTN|nr:hypothetical protein [Halopolyspora algeriensis]RCW43120.1 hypothetical protein DFQ14_1077 [Halopolyspora algeriensis]TQM56178.1 hypothetical protein FHU43_0971 [Halopolyspora algeriensis]
MREEIADSVALWILLPSLLFSFLVVGAHLWGVPRSIRNRRRKRQLLQLEKAQVEDRYRWGDFHIDWVHYRELSKSEIIDVLGKLGWAFRGEDLQDRGWFLCFVRSPAEAPGQVREASSGQRLTDELKTAEPDVRGQYRLDTSQYGDLSRADIRAAAEAVGWAITGTDPASAGNMLLLSRPGDVVLDNDDGSFVQGATPTELRQDPVVAARAEEIKRDNGTDPLSPTQLNWARERHKYWAKRFNRQVALAFFYGIFGTIILFGTLGSFEPGDGSRFYVMLAIAVVMLSLLGVAMFRAVLVRRKRRAEIGDFLDAYGELNTLAENDERHSRHQ